MRELLSRFGEQDSLGYFALRRDKSVIWSPTGKACVAYRVVSGVMLASGDPPRLSESVERAGSMFDGSSISTLAVSCNTPAATVACG